MLIPRNGRVPKKWCIVTHVESAGASCAAYAIDEKPELLMRQSVRLPHPRQDDGAHRSAVARCFEESLVTLSKDIAAAHLPADGLDTIFVVAHAPWSHSQTTTGRREYEKPHAVTAQDIADLAGESFHQLSGLDTGNLIETSVVRVLLNGYRTAEPVGKKASRLETVVFASDCDSDMQHRVRESLMRHFTRAGIIWRSAPRALHAIESAHEEGARDYVGIHVGHHASDAFLVRDDLVTARESNAFGMQDLLELFSSEAPEESFTLIELADQGAASPRALHSAHGNLARASNSFSDQWMRSFDALTKKDAASVSLPPAIVIFAPQQIAGLLQSIFSRQEFSHFTHAGAPFSIRVAHTSEDKPHDPDDIIAAAEVILINTAHLPKQPHGRWYSRIIPW